MKYGFLPFSEEMLPQAAELLAYRHHEERKVIPALPARFEHVDFALKAVEAAWKKEHVTGIAAFREDKLVGYLIGQIVIETLRGRHVWVEYAGHGLASTEEPELYRQMYANLAEQWVAYGCFDHYILAPVGNPSVIDAWFRLGFGHEQVHGLLELPDIVSEITSPREITVRLATSADKEAVKDIADVIITHQAKAPVWAAGLPEFVAEIREGYAGLVDDKTVHLWIAEKDGKILGYQGFWPDEASDISMLTPDNCVELGIGGTIPAVRGQGIGRMLTCRGFADSKERGFKFCSTDWRMTNLLSSTFWPKQGFRPTAYRLTRKIDPRVIWATGKA